MKGLYCLSMKKVLAELDEIRKQHEANTGANLPVYLDVLGWLEESDGFETFGDLLESVNKRNKNKQPIIIDDIGVTPDDMYLPATPLYSLDKEEVKAFIRLLEEEVAYMEKYLDLCKTFFNQEDEELQKYIASQPVLADIKQNINLLSVGELVERYKDEQFFKSHPMR